MSIYLLSFTVPVQIPDLTVESLTTARLFGNPTIRVIPQGVRCNISLTGKPGRVELRTAQCPNRTWVDTVGEIYIYNTEVETVSHGSERREMATEKEVLKSRVMIDEERPHLAIARRIHPKRNDHILDHIVIYESNRDKGDQLSV